MSVLKHLASKEHKGKVIDFLKEMGTPNDNRNKYYVQQSILKQFLHGGEVTPSENASSTASTPIDTPLSLPSAEGDHVSAPTSPTTSLDATVPSLPVADGSTDQKVPRTVTGLNGIKQNPSGWDGGERVWGGGIVKYKKAGEWQPWPIDLDNESDVLDPTALMGGQVPNSFLKPTSAQNNIVATVPVGTVTSSNGVFTHPSLATAPERKQTEYAYSSELTRIEPIPLQSGQGNVHSGALPPWMVDDTGSVIPTITPFEPLSEREKRLRKNNVRLQPRKNTKKIGADAKRVQPGNYRETWLPNFGSVWQAGPRSETRKSFKEVQDEKKRSRVITLPTSQQNNAPPTTEEINQRIHNKLVNLNKQQR